MKNSIKYLTFVQAALVSFILVGCSNINTAPKPTVRDAVAKVTTEDDRVERRPSALAGRSQINSSDRSNSVWMSYLIVKEPAAQGIQGHYLEANDASDIKPTQKSQFNKQITRRNKRPKGAPQRSDTLLVNDALEEVFGGNDTTRESPIHEVLVDIIGNGNETKEASTE